MKLEESIFDLFWEIVTILNPSSSRKITSITRVKENFNTEGGVKSESYPKTSQHLKYDLK